jgi:hypothetical protein
MIVETARRLNLPEVSARETMLLAALGLGFLAAGLAAGLFLIFPAGAAGLAGLATGLSRSIRVWRGRAFPREGPVTLVAATFVNGSLTLYLGLAIYILLRFGA